MTNEQAVVLREQVLPATRDEAKAAAELSLAVAEERAKIAAKVIEEKGLFKKINNKKFVFVDGWTTLAAMYSLAVTIAWTKTDDEGVAYARGELVRTDTGEATGIGAESECGGQGDDTWINRTAMAKRSMAQTRATSKVCRLALSWVMVMAGFQGTPAEEMNGDSGEVKGKSTRGPTVAQLRMQAQELMQKAVADEKMSRVAMQEWVDGICKGVFVVNADGQGATIYRNKMKADDAKTIIAALAPKADEAPTATPTPAKPVVPESELTKADVDDSAEAETIARTEGYEQARPPAAGGAQTELTPEQGSDGSAS